MRALACVSFFPCTSIFYIIYLLYENIIIILLMIHCLSITKDIFIRALYVFHYLKQVIFYHSNSVLLYFEFAFKLFPIN